MKTTAQKTTIGVVKDAARARAAADEIPRVAMGVGILAAALAGLWGMACMAGAIAQSGLGEVVRGYFAAIGG